MIISNSSCRPSRPGLAGRADLILIDGAAHAARLRAALADRVAHLQSHGGKSPGLAVILVGDDPASTVYVNAKARAIEHVGMYALHHHLPATTSEDALLTLLGQLGQDDTIHGILVQLPLPAHIDTTQIINAIPPAKDVDGFHVINSGRLMAGLPGLVPCTPLGCRLLLRDLHGDMTGLHALVLGRSNIVGKPMAALLLQENCTVTQAHSRTRDLPDLCRQADILVAAVGRPCFVRGAWIKRGATIIDVGINRIQPPPAAGPTLTGDVDFETVSKIAGAITPVPGGVGPMTIACLLSNTLSAYCSIHRLPVPDPLDLLTAPASAT